MYWVSAVESPVLPVTPPPTFLPVVGRESASLSLSSGNACPVLHSTHQHQAGSCTNLQGIPSGGSTILRTVPVRLWMSSHLLTYRHAAAKGAASALHTHNSSVQRICGDAQGCKRKQSETARAGTVELEACGTHDADEKCKTGQG